MARNTPLKWIQTQGGWASAKMLLDTYGHYLPDEHAGYANAITRAPKRPYAAPHRSDGARGARPAQAPQTESRVIPALSRPREWSARRDSNPRLPAWEEVSRIA